MSRRRLRPLPLAIVLLGAVAFAPELPAATGYACGDGKPNLATKRCDCPQGKVEQTNAKGISTCVAPPPSPKPTKPAPSAAASGKCPPGMAEIPGGTFPLDETKQSVTVAAFCVDVNEVTVSDYAACLNANACAPPTSFAAKAMAPEQLCNYRRAGRALHPINCVEWEDASSYCTFAKKRLPTDEEWEWVARNGDRATTYPWGVAAPDETRANVCGAECPAHMAATVGKSPKPMFAGDDGFPETAPVGSFAQGKNRWGVNDLAGNVWEWTSTPFLEGGTSMRIARGGSFLAEDAKMIQSGLRGIQKPGTRMPSIGFRCASTR